MDKHDIEKYKMIVESYGEECYKLDDFYECLHCIKDINELYKKINIDIFNIILMKKLFCIFMKYFEEENLDKVEPNYEKKLIKKEKKYDLYSMSNLFSMKIWHDKNLFFNECFVYILGMNKMREKIMNFPYMYGFMTKKQFISFYENIDGEDIGKFLRRKNNTDNILLQLLFALAFVEKEIGFSNYNLKENNIIIKKLDKKYNIPYYDKDGNLFYIKSKYIPIILDLSFSTIKYNEINYGLKNKYTFTLKDCLSIFKIFKNNGKEKGYLIKNYDFEIYEGNTVYKFIEFIEKNKCTFEKTKHIKGEDINFKK